MHRKTEEWPIPGLYRPRRQRREAPSGRRRLVTDFGLRALGGRTAVEIDLYPAEHRPEWQRLARLVARRTLSGPEADELVTLYQRAATHLSVIRSASPDPALGGWLSTLVARARSAVTGSPSPAWRDAARFLVVGFPAAC